MTLSPGRIPFKQFTINTLSLNDNPKTDPDYNIVAASPLLSETVLASPKSITENNTKTTTTTTTTTNNNNNDPESIKIEHSNNNNTTNNNNNNNNSNNNNNNNNKSINIEHSNNNNNNNNNNDDDDESINIENSNTTINTAAFEENTTCTLDSEDEIISGFHFTIDGSTCSSHTSPEKLADPTYVIPEYKLSTNLDIKVDDVTTEERLTRLRDLLDRSSLFTEVIGGQIQRQHEIKKKKLAKQESKRKLKSVSLVDISPTLGMKNRKRTSDKNNENNSAKRICQYPSNSKSLDESMETINSPTRQQNPARYFNGKKIPSDQPLLLSGAILRSYQIEGYEWLKILNANGVNGILADEMGLGKTIQAITMICFLMESGLTGSFLIMAPLSTLKNWEYEFNRFAPKIPTLLYHGDRIARKELTKKLHASINKKRNANLYDKDGMVNSPPVVITSYELLKLDFKTFSRINWRYLVLDEGQKIKNQYSSNFKQSIKLDAEAKVILTGTPIQNNLLELWSLLHFLMPAIFTDSRTFSNWFKLNGDMTKYIIDQEMQFNIIQMVQKIIKPFILRRIKADVELDLPPKKEILVYCPLTRLQQSYYIGLLRRSILESISKHLKQNNIINDEEYIEDEESNKHQKSRNCKKPIDYAPMSHNDFEKILSGEHELPADWCDSLCTSKQKNELPFHINVSPLQVGIQLRKAINHPYLIAHPCEKVEGGKLLLISEDTVTLSGKMQMLDLLLEELIQRGHKMLIFSQWTRILDIIQDLMELREIEFTRLDGNKSLENREEEMQKFRTNCDVKCFLITTRAGGLGLNLVAADTVIIFDSDWNPHCDLQAQDRCHRIGQEKPVIVYRLVAAKTIDEKLVERAWNKRKLERILINNANFGSGAWSPKGVPHLSVEDLKNLLGEIDYDEVFDGRLNVNAEHLNALLDRSNFGDIDKNKLFKVLVVENNASVSAS